MKSGMTMLITLLVLYTSCASQSELGPLEKKYLSRFGNYTGNMGLGFVPEDTFDYNFRQTIVNSKDKKVQKAFILDRLPREINYILRSLRDGRRNIGKGVYRKLHEKERNALLSRFTECMTLLQKLDAGRNEHFYSTYQTQLDNILNDKKK